MQRKPFILKTIMAVAACKATRAFLRNSGRGGGTALPGKVARKFSKRVLETTSDGMDIIVVTGTNGKTTTANMLETALTESGIDVLANKSGANLLSGVTAEFACAADFLGRPRRKVAVIECDEGALKQVVPEIHPKVILVTNLFRDQLDRYGEVMNTLKQIRMGVEKDPDATLVLNADDSLVSSLGLHTSNRKVYFGLDLPVGDQSPRVISDALHCIRCGEEYKYHYYTYAHLGSFYCPKCGYSRVKPDFAVERIDQMNADGSSVALRIGDKTRNVTVGLPAVYNLYNAIAATAAFVTFGGKAEDICRSLSTVHSSFGRMEKFDLPRQISKETSGIILEGISKGASKAVPEGISKGASKAAPEGISKGASKAVPEGISKASSQAAPERISGAVPEGMRGTEPERMKETVSVRMILVKNPAGCSQTIDYLSRINEDFRLVICLNDRTADGHDISWIWDADYERLAENTHIQSIIVSGDRAEDLRVRLKYAGVDEKKVTMEKDNGRLLASMRGGNLPVFVMPNYTSMLALRKMLSDATGKKEFWEKQA